MLQAATPLTTSYTSSSLSFRIVPPLFSPSFSLPPTSIHKQGSFPGQVVGDMLQAEVPPDHITYELLFTLLHLSFPFLPLVLDSPTTIYQPGSSPGQVVGDMLQAAIPPDHITYELLFDYPDEGDRLARVLFASVKRVMSREAVEDQYNKLLMALTRKRRWEEVELVVDQAHEEGCKLDKRTLEGAIEKMADDKKVTMVRGIARV